MGVLTHAVGGAIVQEDELAKTHTRSTAAAIAIILQHHFVSDADDVNPLDFVNRYKAECPRVGHFACSALPHISLEEYIAKLMHYVPCPRECFVGALCLLLDLTQSSKRGALAPLCQWTVHRVFLTCLVLAIKLLNDHSVKMKWIGYVGGIRLQELIDLEWRVLEHLDFHVNVPVEHYQHVNKLLKTMEL